MTYKQVVCKPNDVRFYTDGLENSVTEPKPAVQPDPAIAARRTQAEMTIAKLLFDVIVSYDALQDVMEMADLNIDNLMLLKERKNVPDSVITQLSAALVIPKINLEGLTDATWFRIWEGFKSRLPGYIQQIAVAAQQQQQQPAQSE